VDASCDRSQLLLNQAGALQVLSIYASHEARTLGGSRAPAGLQH
jgi:hypothetical protein